VEAKPFPLKKFDAFCGAAVCALCLAACSEQQVKPIQTFQSQWCERMGLGYNCEGMVARSLWWPDILIVDAPDGPRITCQNGPRGQLQVTAHVKNYEWSASELPYCKLQPGWRPPTSDLLCGTLSGGPFWTQFDTTYTEAGAGYPTTKTYYVSSTWPYDQRDGSGAQPALAQGLLVAGGEADIVVIYDSRRTNPASLASAGENIDATNGPFTVRVRTNVPNPMDPGAALPNVGTSDKTVTCPGF
jgi:hypothetical protein